MFGLNSVGLVFLLGWLSALSVYLLVHRLLINNANLALLVGAIILSDRLWPESD